MKKVKYDCTNTVDMAHETERMCNFYSGGNGQVYGCRDCPLRDLDCHDIVYAVNLIPIVQSWSDTHPEETLLNYFKKIFPNVEMDDDGTPNVCAKNLRVIEMDFPCSDCVKCWTQPYAAPKEKTVQKP